MADAVQEVEAAAARATAHQPATTTWLNGMPGARIDIGGAATAASLVVEDGRITRIYAIRNPHKLGWLEGSQNREADLPATDHLRRGSYAITRSCANALPASL